MRHYALIREAIVDYMLTAGELTLRHFHMEHTIKDYIEVNSVAKNGEWAMDTEIAATAGMLKTDVFVYCKFGKTNEWQRFRSRDFVSDLNSKIEEKGIYICNFDEHFTFVKNVGQKH